MSRPRGRLSVRYTPAMRYRLKQKLFSWTDRFTIEDESGVARYFVDGAMFSFGDKLQFRDVNGQLLVYIEQKLFNWGPTYEIYRGNVLAAVVKKKLFTFFKCEFMVDVPGPDDLTATGDLLEHEYAFERGGRTVARVSKRWFQWSDTYGVDIADEQDDVLILAAAVVIDMVCHDGDRD